MPKYFTTNSTIGLFQLEIKSIEEDSKSYNLVKIGFESIDGKTIKKEYKVKSTEKQTEVKPISTFNFTSQIIESPKNTTNTASIENNTDQ